MERFVQMYMKNELHECFDKYIVDNINEIVLEDYIKTEKKKYYRKHILRQIKKIHFHSFISFLSEKEKLNRTRHYPINAFEHYTREREIRYFKVSGRSYDDDDYDTDTIDTIGSIMEDILLNEETNDLIYYYKNSIENCRRNCSPKALLLMLHNKFEY